MAQLIRQEIMNVAEFFELNEQQSEVTNFIGRNCVINAGAGTGKTKTLTAAYIDALINMRFENGDVITPDNIVAITYTKAAAEELRSRITAGLVALGREDVAELMGDAWIMTIHAFCIRVLKSEQLNVARQFGIDTNFKVIEGADAKLLQNEIASAVVEKAYLDSVSAREDNDDALLFKMLNQEKVKKAIINIAGKMRTFGISSDNLTADHLAVNGYIFEEKVDCANKRLIELTKQYFEQFQNAKIAQGLLDFADLILYTRKLFADCLAIREKYKAKFGVLLIDEFQDTNAVQFEVFQCIATENLIVVGDKRQSIYAFQGADVSVFDSVLEQVKQGNFSEVKLQKNYRSHKDVLDKINEVFSAKDLFGEDYVPLQGSDLFNESHAPKHGEQERTRFVGYLHEKNGSKISPNAEQYIADEFNRLIDEEGYSPNDLVVLAPKRSLLVSCADALRAKGLNTRIIGGDKLLSDMYVQGLFDVLCAIDNPYDDQALEIAALSVMGNVSDADLARAAQFVRAAREGKNGGRIALWEGFLHCAGEKPNSTMAFFVDMVQTAAKMLAIKPLGDIARYVFSASGAAYYLQDKQFSTDDFDSEEQFADVLAFIDLIDKRLAAGMSNRTCLLLCKQDFENEEKIEFGTIPESFEPDAEERRTVRLMTIHKSKGLEFPVVAVYGYEHHKTDSGGVTCSVEQNPLSGERSLNICISSYSLTPEEVALTDQLKSGGVTKSSIGIKSTTYNPLPQLRHKETAKQQEIEEGARKFYVAMTRAKERLLFVYASDEPNKVNTSINNIALSCKPDEEYVFCETKKSQDIVEDVEEDYALRRQQREQRVRELFVGAPLEELTLEVSPSDYATWPEADKGKSENVHLEEITASGIEQYHSCPRQFNYSALMRIGLLSQTNAAMNRGTAMHTSLEQMANLLLQDEEGSENREHMLNDVLPSKIQNLYALDESDVASVIRAVRSAMASDFWSEMMACSCVQTEAQFYEALDQGDERFFLHGYIDICGQKADGSWLALDYKSGKGGATREKYETQAKCYALALLRAGASKVEIIFVRPEVEDKEKTNQCESFSFKYETSDVASIEKFLCHARTEMERAGFVENEELKNRVDKNTCYQCSYRGPLCPGVSQM